MVKRCPHTHRRHDDPRGLLFVAHDRNEKRAGNPGLRGRQMHRRMDDERGIYNYHERVEK